MDIKKLALPLIALVLLVVVVLRIFNSNGENVAVKDSVPEKQVLELRFGHNTPENSALHQEGLLVPRALSILRSFFPLFF